MFHYFGYGSNLNLNALRAKGVEPLSFEPVVLRGWKLVFNVRHWFQHEGGVGNIIATNNPEDKVHGLLCVCKDDDLPLLDLMESYGVAYDRIELKLETASGLVSAKSYVGLPDYLDDTCLPSRRYLNILLKGANAAGLAEEYIEKLRHHPLHHNKDYPPFLPPALPDEVFNQKSLKQHPLYTAVAGSVFDMKDARRDLQCIWTLFGGKDMTLFHLKRLDSSDGSENLEDIKCGRISEAGQKYLNTYLHEYDKEYRYVGRYVYY